MLFLLPFGQYFVGTDTALHKEDVVGLGFLRPFPVIMIGGMFSATLLALLVIPALYVLWQRRHLDLG
ncbi:MAG: hypothetical protein WCY67_07445 [Acidithiobacillus sp.]